MPHPFPAALVRRRRRRRPRGRGARRRAAGAARRVRRAGPGLQRALAAGHARRPSTTRRSPGDGGPPAWPSASATRSPARTRWSTSAPFSRSPTPPTSRLLEEAFTAADGCGERHEAVRALDQRRLGRAAAGCGPTTRGGCWPGPTRTPPGTRSTRCWPTSGSPRRGCDARAGSWDRPEAVAREAAAGSATVTQILARTVLAEIAVTARGRRRRGPARRPRGPGRPHRRDRPDRAGAGARGRAGAARRRGAAGRPGPPGARARRGHRPVRLGRRPAGRLGDRSRVSPAAFDGPASAAARGDARAATGPPRRPPSARPAGPTTGRCSSPCSTTAPPLTEALETARRLGAARSPPGSPAGCARSG